MRHRVQGPSHHQYKGETTATDLLGLSRVRTLRTVAVSLPCLGALIDDIGAAASGFGGRPRDGASAGGPVVGGDPNAHDDRVSKS